MDVGHWDNRIELMKKMAAASGRDLPLALASGMLSGLKLRSCAIRCFDCNHANACRQVLAKGERLEAAPDFCANKATFDVLPPLAALPDQTAQAGTAI